MDIRNYWLDGFSEENWQVFLNNGACVTGFSEGHKSIVQLIKPNDYLLCYLKKRSVLIGCLEVISEPFWSNEPIWREDVFPRRVPVKVIVNLPLEAAISIKLLKDRLSIFDPENPKKWTGFVRQAPRRWNTLDAEIIVGALLKAQSNSIA